MGNGSALREERRIRAEGLDKQTCMEGCSQNPTMLVRSFVRSFGASSSSVPFVHTLRHRRLRILRERERATKRRDATPPETESATTSESAMLHVRSFMLSIHGAAAVAAAATAAYNFSLSASRTERNELALPHSAH